MNMMLLRRLDGRRAFIVLVLIAALIRFVHMAFMAGSPLFLAPTSDAAEHYQLATTLASGDWLGQSVGPYHRPQLFAYVMAFVYTVFGDDFRLTHLLLWIIDSLAVGVWYLVARRCFPRIPAFLGGLFIALHWPFVYFAASGYMESFAMALSAVMFLFLATAVRRSLGPGIRRGFAYHLTPVAGGGVMAGLSILTRPTVVLVVPFLALVLFTVQFRAWKQFGAAVKAPLVFLAITGLTISPNLLRHHFMFGMFAPLGTGSELNFHMGNRIDGWGWDVSSPGIEYRIYQNLPIIEADLPPDIPEVRKWWRERSREYVFQQTGDFARGMAIKVLQLMNAWEIHCTQDYLYSRERSPVLRLLPGLGLFGPLGLAGVCLFMAAILFPGRLARQSAAGLDNHRAWVIALLVLWIVVYTAGVALYLSISRHRLPVIPPLLLLAGWFAWFLACQIVRRRFATVACAGALLVAAVIVTRLPVIPREYYVEHERWWTRINLATALIQLGQPDRAIGHLEEAAEILPGKMETWQQLAVAHRLSGNHNDALTARKQLLMRMRSQYPDFYMIEAEILEQILIHQLEAGLPGEAVNTGYTLTRLVPESPQSWLVLAVALEVAGRMEEAAAAASEAIARDPGLRQRIGHLLRPESTSLPDSP